MATMEQIVRTHWNSPNRAKWKKVVTVNPTKYTYIHDYAAQALDDCLQSPGPRPIPGFSGSLLVSPVVPVEGFDC